MRLVFFSLVLMSLAHAAPAETAPPLNELAPTGKLRVGVATGIAASRSGRRRMPPASRAA